MSERITHCDMVYELVRMIASKATWLADFSSGPKKRPDHEINHKMHELRVLEQARDDYRRAHERVSVKAGAVNGLEASAAPAARNGRVDARQSLQSEQKGLARNA